MIDIVSKYRGKGFKLTPQRIAILEFLEGNTSHPTAEDIYTEIRKKHPTLSFATVYNTVQVLIEKGELSEITIDPGRKHFDPNSTHHHHIICTQCRRIGDIFVDFSEALVVPEDVLKGFSVLSNHVDFKGLCRSCRQ